MKTTERETTDGGSARVESSMGGGGDRVARIVASHVGRTFALPLANDAVRVVESVDGAGVTLAATTALPPGVVAAATPFRQWATRSAAFARSTGGSLLTPFEREAETFRDTVALALCLLNERFAGESSYASTLPDSFDFLDASLSDAHATALEGTSTHKRLRGRGAFVRAVSEATSLSPRDVAWAVGAVSSRAMKNDAVPYALVPGCDLLDHASSPNCVVRRRDEPASDGAQSSPSVVVETTRAVAAGERLTISYGDDMCNDRALRMYGFCAHELTVNDTRNVLVRGLGSFRGVHPSNAAFEESVRRVVASGARDDARDAWTVEREAWLRSEEIASSKSADVDESWMRRVAVLRRGQAEIIDAYVRAFK